MKNVTVCSLLGLGRSLYGKAYKWIRGEKERSEQFNEEYANVLKKLTIAFGINLMIELVPLGCVQAVIYDIAIIFKY